jgi:hypothetical protein
MPRFSSISTLAIALLVAAPSLAALAEPAAPRDPCAYMNHDSKAYFACRADQAAARQRAEATPPPPVQPTEATATPKS